MKLNYSIIELFDNELKSVVGGTKCYCLSTDGAFLSSSNIAATEHDCRMWCCLGDGSIIGVTKWSCVESWEIAEGNAINCDINLHNSPLFTASA